MMINVATRLFRIWRLEKWYVHFDLEQFRPKGRLHLGGSWYWKSKSDKEEWKELLAKDLSKYIADKHTQEECTSFIDGYNAALKRMTNN